MIFAQKASAAATARFEVLLTPFGLKISSCNGEK
jgi:hypothetical protein